MEPNFLSQKRLSKMAEKLTVKNVEGKTFPLETVVREIQAVHRTELQKRYTPHF